MSTPGDVMGAQRKTYVNTNPKAVQNMLKRENSMMVLLHALVRLLFLQMLLEMKALLRILPKKLLWRAFIYDFAKYCICMKMQLRHESSMTLRVC